MKIPTLVSNSSTIRKPVSFLLIAGLLCFSQLSSAAGDCKGMQQDACSSDISCSWINSYTTKKGNTIKAYCRNKSKSSNSTDVPDNSTADRNDKQG